MTSKMKINASPRCVPDSVVLRNNKKRDFDPTKRKVWIYFFRIAVNRATTRTQEDQEEQEGEEEQTRRTTTTTTSSTSTHPPELQLSYQRTCHWILRKDNMMRWWRPEHLAGFSRYGPRAPCRSLTCSLRTATWTFQGTLVALVRWVENGWFPAEGF